MRNEKRGFRRILKPRTGSEFRRIVESDEPLDLSEVPLSKDGGIAQVFKEAADFCADLESREQTPEATWASGPRNQDSPAARGPFQEIAKVEPSQLPELPPKFQHAFEAAKANAELVQAKLARRIPHPALSGISRLKLIQDVFFAYCAQARAACRAGELTLTQMRQVTETALPVICDLYFIRDYGTGSDDARSTFRVQFTRVVADDPQWRQHLSEVAELAEGASPTSGGTTGGAGGNPSTAKANDTPPKVRAAPLDVAHPKRLQSTISSPLAARRVEAYLDSNPMKRTEFAVQAQTTDRTLRSFRKTGKVRRDIFENIAKAMGVTPEALLKQE
jgi:hypothetical protein